MRSEEDLRRLLSQALEFLWELQRAWDWKRDCGFARIEAELMALDDLVEDIEQALAASQEKEG